MKSLVKPLLLASILTLAFLSLHLGWWGPVTEEVLLQDLFKQNRLVAWPVFIAGAVLYTALGGPRQVLAFSSGFLFGGWQGGLIGTLLTGAGAMLTMFAVQRLGMDWVRKKYAQKIELIKAVLAEDTWIWICVIRLIPVGSNLVTNIAAALSDLRPVAVLLGSLLGYLPQMLLFSYAGSGIALHDSSQIWMSLVMLVLSTGLGMYLYHHGFKQRLKKYRNTPAPLPGAVLADHKPHEH